METSSFDTVSTKQAPGFRILSMRALACGGQPGQRFSCSVRDLFSVGADRTNDGEDCWPIAQQWVFSHWPTGLNWKELRANPSWARVLSAELSTDGAILPQLALPFRSGFRPGAPEPRESWWDCGPAAPVVARAAGNSPCKHLLVC